MQLDSEVSLSVANSERSLRRLIQVALVLHMKPQVNVSSRRFYEPSASSFAVSCDSSSVVLNPALCRADKVDAGKERDDNGLRNMSAEGESRRRHRVNSARSATETSREILRLVANKAPLFLTTTFHALCPVSAAKMGILWLQKGVFSKAMVWVFASSKTFRYPVLGSR